MLVMVWEVSRVPLDMVAVRMDAGCNSSCGALEVLSSTSCPTQSLRLREVGIFCPGIQYRIPGNK